MKRNKLFILFFALFILVSGCSYVNENNYDNCINKDDSIIFEGKKIDLESLLNDDNVIYSIADVDNDGILEIGFRTSKELFVINVKEKEVIYCGSCYDNLLDYNGEKGIIYIREGGAPTHKDYQYFKLDDRGNTSLVFKWACYDINENNVYEEDDLYDINGQTVTCSDYVKKTELYSDLTLHLSEWMNFVGDSIKIPE